jgi:hypothetical protein
MCLCANCEEEQKSVCAMAGMVSSSEKSPGCKYLNVPHIMLYVYFSFVIHLFCLKDVLNCSLVKVTDHL